MTPTNADLRQFILQFFSDEELETLCFDYFREAQQNFSDGMTRNRKVILLIGYCDTRGRLDDLYAALERERPTAWREEFGAPPAPKTRFFPENRVSLTDPRPGFFLHAPPHPHLSPPPAFALTRRGARGGGAPRRHTPRGRTGGGR